MGETWALLTGVTFVLASVVLFMILHLRQRSRREEIIRAPVASQASREASHDLANESTKLKAGLQRLSVAPNPIRSLVEAIEGAAKKNGSNNGHA